VIATKVGIDDLITGTGATAMDLEQLERIETWPVLAPEARHGLLGRLVDELAPYSEADPVGMLGHAIAGLGNLIGPKPHTCVAADVHPCRSNVLLVGDTSTGRKGSAWGPVRAVLERLDGEWASKCIASGLSTAEGLIYHVRDAREEKQPVKEGGRVVDYQSVIVDGGVDDKRLFAIESEFSMTLRRMSSETNTLSSVIRQAWDSGNLATITKGSPMRATGAHIGIVGHITPQELAVEMRSTEQANGFANRFLFFVVKRSQLLPEGAKIPASLINSLAADLSTAVAFARNVGEVRRDPEATEDWKAIYEQLSGDGPGGLAGAVIGRAAPQVLRLSLLYALLDRSTVIRPVHLHAALAVWDHAQASAKRIFGDVLGLPLADRIVALLRAKGPMTTTDMHNALKRHAQGADLQAALDTLESKGKVRKITTPTKGRPSVTYEALGGGA
jgi:hypothetical protein